MPLPPDIETREILWNIGPVTKTAMYLLFAVSMVIFGRGFYARWKVWNRGQKSLTPGLTISQSIMRLVRHVFVQQRISRIPLAWGSHMLVFYGFIVLFIGTVIVAVQDYGSMIGLPYFFQGTFYKITSFSLDLFGLGFIIGLIAAMTRRVGSTSVRPSSKPIDRVILWLFLLIALSGFKVEALRLAYDAPAFEKHVSFVAWYLADVLRAIGISGDAAKPWHLLAWWSHMLLVFAFIAIIPYTKLLHFMVAPVHIATVPAWHSGRFNPVSLEQVEETGRFGLSTIPEFSRQSLISYDACTHCRRCESACPAFATHKPLSPMRVILDIAEHGNDEGSLHGDVISAETLWSCTTCGACVHQCPVLIDQMGTIVEMRRHLVGEGQVLGSTQAALRSITSVGNPWGSAPDDRDAWAAGLDVPTVETNPTPDVLLWIGCAGSFDRRNQRVSQSLAKILKAAKINFAIMGKKERCTGDPARRLGDEFTFLEQATSNVEKLSAVPFKKIVTGCAHCFNTLRNEYPDFGGSYVVEHHTQFIAGLIESGQLTLQPKDGEGPIALHDPCYLSRHNRMEEAPRRVLAGLQGPASSGPASNGPSLSIVEPEAHGCNTFCCGAGGGRMWMEEDIDKRVNLARWEQLKATGAKTVATACPFCTIMLDDAAKADSDSGIEVKDVAELVAERL